MSENFKTYDSLNGSITSMNDFRHVMRCERERADRCGSPFSLVVFAPKNGSNYDGLSFHTAEQLVQLLEKRTRSVDEIGWYDKHNIGVLLPATDRHGADKFVNSVVDRVSPQSKNGDSFSYSIYSHSKQSENGKWCVFDDKIHDALVRKMPLWKRPLDIIGSLVGLILFSPVYLLIACFIKIVSQGPILFKQSRVGYKGRLFSFFKFRTMRVNNDVKIHQSHLKDLISTNQPMGKLDDEEDARIIPGGKIIRKLAIDELPQFYNILRGDMSLVGPRPCISYEAEEYLRWHTHRFDIVPGLTGLWQVSGKNMLTFQEMIRLDISYCKNISLWLDVKILLRTFPALFRIAIEAAANRVKQRVNRSH